jgi:WYL domain-containing protein
MTKSHRAMLEQAIANQRTATVQYNAPLRGGVVTRHVRSYELSINRSGRSVLWCTDSIHGARRIHSFRLDRIVSVDVSARAAGFEKAKTITADLIHEGAGDLPRAPSAPPRAIGRPSVPSARPTVRRPPAPAWRPRAMISIEFGRPLKGARR